MTADDDFWNSLPDPEMLDGEGNVGHRLVLPLLHALGYSGDDIESSYPVVFQEGRAGRKPEADFVCFYGVLRDKSNSLLVVEVKRFGEPLAPGKAQGESYAQNLRTPLLVLTNGENLEIWQMQITHESECVLSIPVCQLLARRGDVERLLNKTAVRDYCARLKFKTVVEATSDFGAYETAELTRLKAETPAIERTLRIRQVGLSDTEVNSTSLLELYRSGAVILGPSGYGKTTLSRNLVKQALESRWRGSRKSVVVDAPLPDIEQSEEEFLEFLHRRITAHQPGITLAGFKDSARKLGLTVVCDGLDRTSHGFQKRIATAITLFLRDYPLSQVFLFSRGVIPPMQALPVLEILPLSDIQVRELENTILSDGSAENYSIIGAAPPTLRTLCSNPLILVLLLKYWEREHDFPRNVDGLFQSWLGSILETEPNDLVARTRREQALSLVAQVTTTEPVTSSKVIALLKDHGIPENVLNELVQCNAIRETGAILEIQHDGLADYLRAKAFAAKSVGDQIDAIPDLALSPESFLPVLLMAQLNNREAQEALWRHLVSGHMSIYLDALRYRRDTSGELKRLDSKELSSLYLTDLLNGIEEPLDGFFPVLRPAIAEWLTEERNKPLSIIGGANAHALHYKIFSRQPNEPRIVVGTPEFPGTIRGVNLDLAKYRADSARLLGITLLKKGLGEIVEALDVVGGPLWSAERLTARVRLLSQRYGFQVSVNDDLNHIEKVLQPYADRRIKEGFYVGQERFSFRSILDDVALLRGAGVDALDPWWTRLGWKDDITQVSNEELSRILDEEYRRVQQVYAEIVRASFAQFADDLIFYPILPIRWKLTVARQGAFNRTFIIFPHWTPVRDWNDAGADVTFSENGPERYPSWEEARDALSALGRPINVPHYGGFTTHFGYDGSMPTGYFKGTSPVANEVLRWLREELGRIFRELPSSDGAFAV